MWALRYLKIVTNDSSPRTRVAHSWVWEAEKLAEKYILIEACPYRCLHRTHHPWWGLGGLLAGGRDLDFKEAGFASQAGKGTGVGKALKTTMCWVSGYPENHTSVVPLYPQRTASRPPRRPKSENAQVPSIKWCHTVDPPYQRISRGWSICRYWRPTVWSTFEY